MGYENRVNELTKLDITPSEARVLAAMRTGCEYTAKELQFYTGRRPTVTNVATRRLIARGYVSTRNLPQESSGRPKAVYQRIISDEDLDKQVKEANETVIHSEATAKDLERFGLKGTEAKILEFLLAAPKRWILSVEITRALGVTQATISASSKRLKEYGWVTSSQRGYRRLKEFEQIKSDSLKRLGIT